MFMKCEVAFAWEFASTVAVKEKQGQGSQATYHTRDSIVENRDCRLHEKLEQISIDKAAVTEQRVEVQLQGIRQCIVFSAADVL